ncbi:hypothetical protein CEP10_13285 [Cylindrospermopsis raciborskii S07]|uniref:Uncharacterized protein n=1 Tax=Cylindrospermopsis raciborskii CS-505 TaxID=533240 RepID=A0A853MC18_9CYAN|nr:hypothetical protein CRC_00701 [Cylindrospermopsis raciborskii CS-505]PNK01843.1 hypothetical protein CEP12_17985 [Cylindrospermopsis raciborskii S14]PNK03077.1 hypothetical protein CEP11_14170 [Cylindrospermopsis raciborskii S10]PNK04405.1 hypothetical protein CEP10_13285 [Cylindrospermopsis raciborskii S07]PNK10318.1 hypothetical protein CEP09_18115 [Cylindrospermopsis raciborskii S06]PNK14465.1 hypothetical protein CEP08_13115 [Cylindrospermopsis raciborskii S05]
MTQNNLGKFAAPIKAIILHYFSDLGFVLPGLDKNWKSWSQITEATKEYIQNRQSLQVNLNHR